MLKNIIDWIFFSLIGLDPGIRWVESLNFFIYDSIKIILLLFFMISIVGILRSYLPAEKIKRWVEKSRYGSGNLIAASFGAITPFCSCSSIPIFLSFIKAKVPVGVTFSFLVTSPIVNEYLVVLMIPFFGWKITAAYVAVGILVGVLSGIILEKLNVESLIEKDIIGNPKIQAKSFKKFNERIMFGINEAYSIVKKLWIWILIGVGIGAIIHNYIPSEVIQSIVNKGGILAVPIAVLIGIPMYANCAAIVPIAIVLFGKGVPLGTALAFMMATSALSLPEAVILRRAMKLKLILIFFAIVSVSIILTGYLFNLIQSFLV